MSSEDKLNELKNKLIALEIHLQNSKKDAERLEASVKDMHDRDVDRLEESLKDLYDNIKNIYEKINGQNTDVNSVIYQFKSIIKEFTELTIEVKDLKKSIDTLTTHAAICDADRENSDIFKYIKNKPAKSFTIFLIIGVLFLLAILLKNPALLLKPLGLG